MVYLKIISWCKLKLSGSKIGVLFVSSGLSVSPLSAPVSLPLPLYNSVMNQVSWSCLVWLIVFSDKEINWLADRATRHSLIAARHHNHPEDEEQTTHSTTNNNGNGFVLFLLLRLLCYFYSFCFVCGVVPFRRVRGKHFSGN